MEYEDSPDRANAIQQAEEDARWEDHDDPTEECWACNGEGYYHDCGEDTCCCLDPETDDLHPCQECGGKGWL